MDPSSGPPVSIFPPRPTLWPEHRGAPLPADEVARLAALMSYHLLDTPPDPKLQSITRLAAERFGVPIALVTLIDEKRQWIKAAYGPMQPGSETRRDHAFCAHTILQPDQPMVVPNAMDDPRFAHNPLVTDHPNIRFYAGVPLVAADGHALGALCLIDTSPRDITALDLRTLQDFAECAAALLEPYRLAAALDESVTHYRHAVEFSPQMPWVANAAGELTELSSRFAHTVDRTVPRLLRHGYVDLVHPADIANARVNWESCRQTGATLDMEFRIRLRDGDYHWFRTYAEPRRDPAGDVLCWYGTLEDIDERKHAQAQVERLADHDTLTGLFNRHRCRQALDARIAAGENFALLSLDLDNLKAINNTLGHRTGDAILRRAAERLSASVATDDILARSGGDEFLVIQTTCRTQAQAATLAQRIHAALGAPSQIEGQTFNLSISIGIALFPQDGAQADTLMQSAALALSRAKAEGRNTHRFYERGMDQTLRHQQELKVDLREAIKRNQLHLAFQPLVNVQTGRMESLEALLRWTHPTWGVVPPVEFIPVAESSGLIVSIGRWVLEQACLHAAAWPADVSVSVNLSAVQFRAGNLAQTIADALTLSALDPARLELEVTESLPLLDDPSNQATLQQIKQLGVRIALDDFGTGYASLGYLQSFPFDKLKIDRSIAARVTEGEKARAIVRAIVGMSHTLHIAVTAEGVETQDQLDCLRDEGCDQVQGYFYSRPVSAADVPALIESLAPAPADI